MTLFDRYLTRNFLLGLLLVLLLLLALFSILALAEAMEDAGQGSFSTLDAFAMVVYTTPRRIVELLPVAMLLGGLVGLGGMANHQELIAARAAGMARPRMARPVLVICLAVVAVMLALQSWMVPAAEQAATWLRAKTLDETRVDHRGRLEFWTRSEGSFLRVNDLRFGRVLADLEIYRVDADGRLRGVIEAGSAVPAAGEEWLLRDVRLTAIDGMRTREEQRAQMHWPRLLTESQAELLVLPLEALAPLELSRLIRHQRENGIDTHHQRVVFWQQAGLPLAAIGMGLLALPLLLGSTRSIPAGQRVLAGGAIGIAFYLLQQLSVHVAGLYLLNPPFAILAPSALLLATALYGQYFDALPRRFRLKPRG